MTDETPKPTNYAGNSKKKQEAEAKPEKKIEKVVTGKVIERKPSLGKRFAASFAGDDAKSVGNYIVFDVIVPAAKNLISDMVSQGIERLLFGSQGSGRSSRGGRSGYISYNRMYKGDEKQEKREISNRGRAGHDFREIILETRLEAEDVLDALKTYISEYGSVTVADFYDMVEVTGNHVDAKWGWYDLKAADVVRVRDGYMLDLPRVQIIE